MPIPTRTNCGESLTMLCVKSARIRAASEADYLVSGDKAGLLVLARHKDTRIVSARDFAALFA